MKWSYSIAKIVQCVLGFSESVFQDPPNENPAWKLAFN